MLVLEKLVDLPPNTHGIQARLDILKIHSRRMNLVRGINLKKIADTMNNASGAEMKVRTNGVARLAPIRLPVL